VLQPYGDAGLKDQLVLLDNLEMRFSTGPDKHTAGNSQMLTGSGPMGTTDGTNYPPVTNQSIDQYLAAQVGVPLQSNWPSLYLQAADCTCSFASDGTLITGDGDPLDVYKKVFGNLSMTGPDPTLVRRLARRQSVLDAV